MLDIVMKFNHINIMYVSDTSPGSVFGKVRPRVDYGERIYGSNM